MDNNRRNYYRILHVQPDAPAEIIKSSYRTLMQRLKNHPDLGGDHWNAALINEAYGVLTNQATREQYDRERQLIRRNQSSSEFQDESEGPATDRNDDHAGDHEVPENTGTPHLPGSCLFCLSPHEHDAITDPDAVCPNCQSPLCPTSEWRLELDGQRAVSRVPMQIDIEFYTTWPQVAACIGRTLDVSPNGMRFSSTRRLGEGRQIKIAGGTIEAVAMVMHCHHDNTASSWVVGVAFETLRITRSQGAFFSAEV